MTVDSVDGRRVGVTFRSSVSRTYSKVLDVGDIMDLSRHIEVVQLNDLIEHGKAEFYANNNES